MVAVTRGLAAVVAGSLILGACSAPSMTSPADIQPVFKIRNSPIPVPDPKWKPTQRKVASKASPSKTAPRTVVRSQTRPQSQPKAASTTSVSNRQHTVQRGETLYALSNRYGVPVRALISANKLRPPYTLSVGQRLTVPVGRVHVVRKGETGYGISRRYGVTASALMKANGIRPPYRLAVGQKLKLPGGAKGPVQTANRRPQAAQPTGRTIARPTPPPRSRAGFEWPLAGKLASRFGPREGGLHNDGINIIAAKGAPVKVADAGVVVYASNALEGYGNLLLVKHSGGWITAYAHTERILVRPGQQVKRGEIVARVGSTGGVASPQLHFEIRKGRQALDPLRYLPGVGAGAR